MSINAFFRDTLGANLKNTQWSWGAVDPAGYRVYLRVWEHQIRQDQHREEVQVYWKDLDTRSGGLNERRQHLDLIRSGGAEGFGVVIRAVERGVHPLRIASFDRDSLLRLGELREDAEGIYARVIERVPSSALEHPQTAASTLAGDLSALYSNRKLEVTTRDALIDARIGQGAFRQAVLHAWGHRCALTGVSTLDAVRASHVKPWRDSTNSERLDPQNGLPLVATVDALFDAALVSFNDEGVLLRSARLGTDEQARLGLGPGARLARAPSPRTREYLAFHRRLLR